MDQRLTVPYPEWRGRNLWIGSIWVGMTAYWPRMSPEWRAWVLTSEDGESVGFYDTEAEAREAVMAAVLAALHSLSAEGGFL